MNRSSRKAHQSGSACAAGAPLIESLEGRALLSATAAIATSIYADNRGGVHIRFNKSLDTRTISSKSIKLFLPGADKTLGTADDVAASAKISYQKSKDTINLIANVSKDVGYRVKLYSSVLKDVDGLKIDGEFHGKTPSGNGVQGGDLEFRVRRDTSALPVVRFNTSMGDVDVTLFRGATASNAATPEHVKWFLRFVDAGIYDNNAVQRSSPGFVVQWGAIKVDPTTGAPGFTQLPADSEVRPPDEPGNHNVSGTIAYALAGGPSTASNEFFFNISNNIGGVDPKTGLPRPNLDDTSTGGGPFTPFGRTNSRGLTILKLINDLHRLNLNNTSLGGHNTMVSEFPVKGITSISGETQQSGGTTTQTISTLANFVRVTRAAVLMKIVAV